MAQRIEASARFLLWTCTHTRCAVFYRVGTDRLAQWVSEICETSLKRLTGLGKPFKYCVTCVIMQKNGAGLHTASSCYWDNGTDGSRTIRWENKTMYCIATVFGLAVVSSAN